MIRLNLETCAFVLLLSLLLGNVAFGANASGTSGADFLEIGVGSRALGMGEAFTAMPNDIAAIYYNPAGLGSLKYPILSFMHQELSLDSRFENVSFAYPLFNGFIALSNSVFWVPPFEKVDINGNNVGDVTFLNGVFTAGYGYDFDFIYLGANFKYIYQKIDTLLLHSYAVDVGLMKGFPLYSPFDTSYNNFNFGLSMQNIGTQAKEDPLPKILRFGISYEPTRWMRLNLDAVQSFADYNELGEFGDNFRINIGTELTYLDILYLRGGWRFNDTGTYSLGAGFNYAIKNVNIVLDTSYSDNTIFGPNYSVTLSFRLTPTVVTYSDKLSAERHYREGVKLFVMNDLDGALREFLLTKQYDPYYKSVDKKIRDIEEIQQLMKENEENNRN